MSGAKTYGKRTFLCLVTFLALHPLLAQQKVIQGFIKDAQNDERIPFASIQFLTSRTGKLSDSAGNFRFHFTEWPFDTLSVTNVGYNDVKIAIDPVVLQRAGRDTLALVIQLERGKYIAEVIVRRKVDRGLLLWRKIVKRKPSNDRFRFSNFSYELYNKLEVDLNQLNFDKLKNRSLLKPFKNLIEQNIDTSEGPAFLPVYLTETVSDYYFRKNPRGTREIIKGSKTVGLKNESISRLLGGTEQVVNIYNDFIPVFDKLFVSPISDNGDNYYRYRVVDTQYVNQQRLFHLIFYPKHSGGNTFTGDCWVHDTTFAIQKITLYLSKEANINFIDKLSLIQEYRMLADTSWFIYMDKFVVNVSPAGSKGAGVIGRKTTTYKNIIYNDNRVENEINKNKLQEEILVAVMATEKTAGYWDSSRHEALSKGERGIYTMLDTMQQMPAFKKYSTWIYFLTQGKREIGNFEIGPWFYWVTYNRLEGTRLRFNVNTTSSFSSKIFLHGYLAYGFLDQKYKYKMDGLYLFSKDPRTHLALSYMRDIDYGQQYYDEISQDNIFALAIRKTGVPIKFMMIDEKKAEVFRGWKSGFSASLATIHRSFNPLLNLPPKSLFTNINGGTPLSTAELSLRLRYSYLEKFIEGTFNRVSLGSDYPTIEARLSRGISGVFKSSYSYTKVSASIADYEKIAPFGTIYYSVFGGRTYGTLPYMLLDIPPGNEIHYYNKYAFNLMNRYEFLHDQYAGAIFQHNIGSGIFRYIPLIKKLKLRQFYSARALWGTLSEANSRLNMPPGSSYTFESLNGRTYLEVGTGVDNILKLFRVDFMWRLSPRPLPKEQVKRFGIFGSFRLVL